MNLELSLKTKIVDAFSKLGVFLTTDDIVIEHSKDTAHGDYATNAALKFARSLGKTPRELAFLLVENIDSEGIEKIEIAGPGFINFFMKDDSLQAIVKKIIEEGENYGRGENKNVKVNVEFVSANPTGPLHIGHARNAAIGDSISRILSFAGYDVTREYYINDAGNQINNLGLSLKARYYQILGLDGPESVIPEDGYLGEDIVDIAQDIVNEYGDTLVNKENSLEFFKDLGIKLELEKIVEELEAFRVTFDTFTSEIEVRKNNSVEKEIEYLIPYSYKEEGAIKLKTTDYLDDKDRVIIKSNGEYTYFLPDIVYHLNKLSRGYDLLIDILGADHHGYVNRMKSALMMHGYKPETLDIELIQMVRIIRDGEEIKMSKRTGDTLTLRELCEYVGVDAARYFFAMRSANMHLDFDLDLALEQSSSNPIYYAFYAHARLASVIDQAQDIEPDLSAKYATTESESALLKHLMSFPDEVESAANERAPFKITNYIHTLAELIHGFYTECRVIDRDNIEVTASRLALCQASKITLKNALDLIGVEAPDRM